MHFFDINESFRNNIMCIDDSGASFSYDQVWKTGDNFIESVPARSLVLLLCANDTISLSTYMALLRKGCVVMLLGQQMESSLTAAMIDNYQPDFLIGPKDVTNRITCCSVAGISSTQFSKVCESGDYLLYSRNAQPSRVVSAIYPRLALLLSTSGSTGDQKLVRLSYDNLQSNCDSIVEYLGLDASERPITTLPMEYTYGLSVLHSHAAVGATVILTKNSFFSPSFWQMMEQHKVSSIAGVPYSYEMLDRLGLTEMNLPYLKTLTQAGGHLNSDLHEKIANWAKKSGRKFFIMYGQTEATARMSYIPPDRCLNKVGSIGIPIPGGRIELLNEQGKPIDTPNVSGELIYYGPNVSLGYAISRGDLAKPDERQGRLETGDIAYRDDDGFLYISGRKKRFIKLYGKRTSLDQIQETLQEEFNSPDIICTGDDESGVRLWTSDQSVINREEELIDFFWNKWSIRADKLRVSKLDEIPRNSSGKVKYAGL